MKLVQKPSGIWRLDYEVEGVRRRVTLGTRDKVEAKARAQRIVLGVEEPPVTTARTVRPADITVAQLLEHVRRTKWREVRSQATINSNIKILCRMVGTLAVSSVTSETITRLRERMEAEGSKPATIQRKLDSLFKALKLALVWDGGTDTGVPILHRLPERPTIRVDNYKDRVVSLEEQEEIQKALIKRIGDEPMRDWQRFRVLLRFLLDTGCRLSEALNVDLDKHFDERDGITFVLFPRYTTKSGKPRSLPLTAGLLQEVETVRSRAIDGKLFPIRAATAWYMWSNLRADLGAGWEDVTLHTFRHTCLTALAKKLPIHKVSLWAGHSDIKITMDRYAHLQSEDLIDCLSALS